MGGVCNVWGVRLTFLPFASAPADGVVRAPVSAACVSALRTPLGTLKTRWEPRACAEATLGPPTRLTFHKFPPFSAGWPKKTFSFIVNSVLYHFWQKNYVPRRATPTRIASHGAPQARKQAIWGDLGRYSSQNRLPRARTPPKIASHEVVLRGTISLSTCTHVRTCTCQSERPAEHYQTCGDLAGSLVP